MHERLYCYIPLCVLSCALIGGGRKCVAPSVSISSESSSTAASATCEMRGHMILGVRNIIRAS